MKPPGIVPDAEFQLPADQPLRRAVRRLRWFKSTFEEQVRLVSAETGVTFRIDRRKVTKCFVQWLCAFEAQKPKESSAYLAYVGFAAGLMLRQLFVGRPLSVDAMPPDANRDDPVYFWPEGYVYVVYCLNVRQIIFKDEFHQNVVISPRLSELRTWWSLKENVTEDPATAIGFLDLFAGDEPDWLMPAVFEGRSTRKIEARRLRRRHMAAMDRPAGRGTLPSQPA